MTIKEILKEYNVPFREAGENEHARVGWVQIDCPYCDHNSQRFHMGFNVESKYFTCYQCGHHPATDVLYHLTRQNHHTIKQILAGLKGQDLGLPAVKSGSLRLPPGTGPLLEPHRRYLEARKLDPDTLVATWGIRATGATPRLPWRIIVPITTTANETVSWTSRTISKSNIRRYINARSSEETVPAKTLLYGQAHARHAIVVVEGPFDAWRIGKGAVATLGIGYSASQFHKMTRYLLRVICFDAEEAAQRRAKMLAESLAMFAGETLNVVLNSKDPACATDREINELQKIIS